MNALEVSKRVIDAWNRHDEEALAALYADGATYHNPRMGNPLKGKAMV
jgi:ketosteroid isomerase-like protein